MSNRKQIDILSLIGDTPMIELKRMSPRSVHIFAKLEMKNIGGSVKDRIALSMIRDAERKGLLQKGGTVVEATSGNTGIGLALIGQALGYNVVLTMPESMSIERRKLLKQLGATLILTDAADGMKGAIEKARSIEATQKNTFYTDQFSNPANPDVHYNTTALEIWNDLGGKIDCLVCGVGTGGTITGAGKRLKELNPNVKVIAVEPAESPVLSGGTGGSHGIQGIGAGFVPPILDTTIIDDVITVSTEDALVTAQQLAANESLLVGISSGAAVAACISVAETLPDGATVATVLPDTAERYLSTNLFANI